MKPKKESDSKGDILIFSGEPEELSDLESILRRNGHKIRWANNMKMMAKSMDHFPPELMIVCCEGAGSSLFEVCWFLKKNPEAKDIPVLFVIFDSTSRSKMKGFRAGGSDYLETPFMEEEVLFRVDTHLKLSRLQRRKRTDDDEAEKMERARRLLTERYSELYKRNEEQYRTVLDSLDDAIISTDRDNKVLLVNRRGASFLGYLGMDPEIVGRDLFEACPLFPDGMRESFGEVMENGRTLVTQQSFDVGGRRIVTEVSMIPISSGDEISRMITVFRDITEKKEAQEALIATHQRMMDIVDFLPDPTFVIDSDRKLIAWNKAMENLTGTSKSKALGKGSEIYSTGINGEMKRCLVDLIFEGTDEEFEREMKIERQGRSLSCERFFPELREGMHLAVKASPLFDRKGRITGAVETLIDMTERVEIEKELRKHREHLEILVDDRTRDMEQSRRIALSLMQDATLQKSQTERALLELERSNREVGKLKKNIEEILHITNTGMIIIDPNYEIGFINSGWEERYGPVAKKKCYEYLFENNDVCPDCTLNNILETGEMELSEKRLTFEREKIFQMTTYPFKEDNGKQSIAKLFIDISRRKEIEEELKKAKVAAESATKTKSDFLAMMSHEIRTPINAIKGAVELVMDTDLEKHQEDLLNISIESVESLLGVINDILDFSKIEAGKLEIEEVRFDLFDLVHNTVDILRYKAVKKNVDLEIGIESNVPVEVMGDPTRLRQIILNLVGNSLKFTDDGGAIFVKVRSARSKGEQGEVELEFSVADTGVGIPEEKLEKIFESFSQADSSVTRKFGGSGLGLSISSKLVSFMGGRMWVESELGKGSTFFFTISGRRPPLEEEVSTEKGPLSGRTLLMISGDRDITAPTRERLERTGADVMLADGPKAVSKIVSKGLKFDLLVVDELFLEGRKRRSTLEMIEKNRSPVILISSGKKKNGDREVAEDLSVIERPVNPDQLFHLIKKRSAKKRSKRKTEEETDSETFRRFDILLVEDNAVNQKLSMVMLEKKGHKVTVAGNGREAIEILKERDFDIVLMDVQMPEMDGLEATRLIRSRKIDSIRPDIPIMAMTAHAMEGDREKCIGSGMDGYIAKPIRMNELFSEIERISIK